MSGIQIITKILSDTCPMSFFLSSHYFGQQPVIELHSSSSGRAIVKLQVNYLGSIKTVMAYIASIDKPAMFSDIVNKVDHQLLPVMIVICDITKRPKPLPVLNLPLYDRTSPDFHIIIDNKKFPAHKDILARNSPVLAAMFDAPRKISDANEITIKDVDYSTMEILLKIIYSRDLDDLRNVDTALKVLQASEKYQMSMVKDACERELQLRIEDDNAVRILVEADKHNASKLCHTLLNLSKVWSSEAVAFSDRV